MRFQIDHAPSLSVIRVGAIDPRVLTFVIDNFGPTRVEGVTVNTFVDATVEIGPSDHDGNPEPRGKGLGTVVKSNRGMTVWGETGVVLPVGTNVFYYTWASPTPLMWAITFA